MMKIYHLLYVNGHKHCLLTHQDHKCKKNSFYCLGYHGYIYQYFNIIFGFSTKTYILWYASCVDLLS